VPRSLRTRRGLLWLLGIAGASGAAFAVGFTLHGGAGVLAGPSPVRRQTNLDQVRVQLISRYYRNVPDRILSLPTISGILAALHDPYTVYLDPTAYKALQRETKQQYPGIGLTVSPGHGGLMVTGDWEGPAHAAGIRPGDTIVSINGSPALGQSLERMFGSTLGPNGTAIRLRVLRSGRLLSFRIVRASISAPTVTDRLLQDGPHRLGYVQITRFAAGTTVLVKHAVRKLIAGGADRLVLDLRGNPGGLLDQAIGVSSLFLSRGVVVSLESVHQPLHRYLVDRSGPPVRLPLVVLVNHGSASAAEIVAAALGEDGRAAVLGERTYGKALVQAVVPLVGGGALKLTTARFITPAGIDISHVGVMPDLPVVDNPSTRQDEVLEAAESLLR
jgi:carboxyl-terminal processing protease